MRALYERLTNHRRLGPLIRSQLARNTGWTLAGQAGRVVVQLLYFVLVGRALGVSGFGELSGALALTYILVPFATWGSGNVMVMQVARDRSRFAVSWGNALLIVVGAGTLALLATVLVRGTVLHNLPLQLVLLLGVAEFYFGRLIDLSSRAFQAVDQLQFSAALNLLPYLSRSIAAVLFVTLQDGTRAVDWGWWYLGGTAVGAVLACGMVVQRLGFPRFRPREIRGTLTDGWYFSISLAAGSIYSDIDKTMLAQLSTLRATGIYTAAYRVLNITMLPVRSLMYASYSPFFKRGAQGVSAATAFGRQLLPFAAGYGLLVSGGLLLFAPLVPVVLGSEYESAVTALRWLALVPLCNSLHTLAANVLTGAGFQRVRSIAQVGLAVFNVGLNLWLIPAYSWRGAAWATLATEALLAVTLWGTILLLRRRELAQRAADNRGGTGTTTMARQ